MQQQQVIDRLRRRGYRMTAQRRALLDVIWSFDGHFTVEAVRAALGDAADLSTIYRTLELLSELGVVHPLAGSSPTEYERFREPHHHLVCSVCGTVTMLADHHFDDLVAHLLDEHGFLADVSHLAIPGRCQPCRDAPNV